MAVGSARSARRSRGGHCFAPRSSLFSIISLRKNGPSGAPGPGGAVAVYSSRRGREQRTDSRLLAGRSGRPTVRRARQYRDVVLEQFIRAEKVPAPYWPNTSKLTAPKSDVHTRAPRASRASGTATSSSRRIASRAGRQRCGHRSRTMPGKPAGPVRGIQNLHQADDHPRAGCRGPLRRQPGNPAPDCRTGDHSAPAHGAPKRGPRGPAQRTVPELCRGDGLDGRIHRVPEIVVGIHEQEGQQLVTVPDVSVDGRGDHPQVTCDGAERECGGPMFRQVLTAQPDDVRDGLCPGPFSGRADFPVGGRPGSGRRGG